MKTARIARRAGVAIVVLLVVLLVVAMLLPRHAIVSRSIEVAAPASAVFPFVGDLRRFNEWSPWLERDPDVKVTFTGPADGVGQTMNWESKVPTVGSGSMSITALDPDQSVAMSIDFGSQGTALASFTLAPKGEATTVTWGFDVDLGFNPIARYFGLMMDGQVGPDYEQGLAKLKTVVEAEAKAKAEAEAAAKAEPAPAAPEADPAAAN